MKMPERYRFTGKGGTADKAKSGTFLIPNDKGKVLLVIAGVDRGLEKLKITTGGSKPALRDLFKVINLFWGEEQGKYTIYYRGSIAGVYFDNANIFYEPAFDEGDHFCLSMGTS